MSQYVDTNTKTFIAGGAIAKGLRVKISSEKLAVAGLTDSLWIGTTEAAAFADGDPVAVRLRAPVVNMVSADAVSMGDQVFTQASGKVGDSEATGFHVGVALSTAVNDGDAIEVELIPLPAVVAGG